MAIEYLFLLAGLLLLFASGKYLVESSVAIARMLGIPTMVIGLTVVAFGTSAPELLVSVQAALKGYPEIAIGNVVGSNIANILLVLAITALIFPVAVPGKSVRHDWPMMMGASVALFLFSLNGMVSRAEGGFFMGLLVLYLGYAVVTARRARRGTRKDLHPAGTGVNGLPAVGPAAGKEMADVGSPRQMRWWTAALIFLVSCGGLAFGADLLVNNAAVIAEEMGVSKRVISITMVAVGTSIPEMATSVIAALKKEADLSVGNVIGSNIMNIISVLGITALVAPVGVERQIAVFDIPWMLGTSLLLWLFMWPAARSRITRWEGLLMIMAYLLYIYLLF